MDPLSATASAITLWDALVSLLKYIKDVKGAKPEIKRLQEELNNLRAVLDGVRRLLDGPKGQKLGTSQNLVSGLKDCTKQLLEVKLWLEKKLGSVNKFSTLKWPFESKDIDAKIQVIRQYRETLSAGLDVDQATLLLESFQLLDDKERLEILDWISPILYRKHHESVKESRTSDTCEWLLQREEFEEWENSSSSGILWLQGSPGAGKTYLTSKVIDHVDNPSETYPSHNGLAFFYCNRNEESRQQPLNVLRSYVRQLSSTIHSPGNVQKRLRNLYMETRLKGSELSFEICKKQLLDSVNLYDRTVLVLDALDECDPDSRYRLVDAIEFLLSMSEKPLKVFISSRPDADIKERFLSRPCVQIYATDNQDDIAKFVNKEIVRHKRWNKISSSLRGEIIGKLLQQSDGMFQWAYLQINQLLKLQTETAIRDRLGKLPTSLEATYDEIYAKISARNEHEKAIADRAFMWVLCASKRLNGAQLLSAIRINPDSDVFGLDEKIEADQLLDICNNLLVCDSHTYLGAWRFSHLSVAEYFEKNHCTIRQSHCHAAKSCLTLLLEKFKARDYESKLRYEDSFTMHLPKYTLQRYTQDHWIDHVRAQEGQGIDPILSRLLKTFLGSPIESSWQYQQWHSQYTTESLDRSIVLSRPISPKTAAIWVICHYSLCTVLLDWCNIEELDLSITNKNQDNLLVVAAQAGCKRICEALVKGGIQVNLALDSANGSALIAAVLGESLSVVEFLIEAGADVNMLLHHRHVPRSSPPSYGSALGAAGATGQLEMSKFLVEKGAEVNVFLENSEHGSALAGAAYHGHVDIVKYLLEEGAEVNMLLEFAIYHSSTALAAAVNGGESDCVEVLLDAGAEVNTILNQGHQSNTNALLVAAGRGYTDCMKALINAGAEVNTILSSYGDGKTNALMTAAWGGHTDCLKALINAGAEVNIKLAWLGSGSVLAAAADGGHKECLEALIHAGAEVNMLLEGDPDSYGSALAAAAGQGHKKCVEILIHSGADVNLQLEYGRFNTALEAAQDFTLVELYGYGDLVDQRKKEKDDITELLRCHGATGPYTMADSNDMADTDEPAGHSSTLDQCPDLI